MTGRGTWPRRGPRRRLPDCATTEPMKQPSLEREYPLTPELLAMSQAWTADDGTRHVAAKGAPEAIAGLCHHGADETAELGTGVPPDTGTAGDVAGVDRG